VAFLLYFPGAVVIVPMLFHYWCVTKHQNQAMRAVGAFPYTGEIATT
jgi:uncharacterized membrane protein YecN with MAPEG domain